MPLIIPLFEIRAIFENQAQRSHFQVQKKQFKYFAQRAVCVCDIAKSILTLLQIKCSFSAKHRIPFHSLSRLFEFHF